MPLPILCSDSEERERERERVFRNVRTKEIVPVSEACACVCMGVRVCVFIAAVDRE